MDRNTQIADLERENRELQRRIACLQTGISEVERIEMLEEQNRLLAAFQQVGQAIHATFDMEEILDALATQVLKVGIFRSLTVGLVDEEAGHIELVRNLLCETQDGRIAPSSKIVSSTHVVIDDRVIESRPIVGLRIPIDDANDHMVLTVQRRSLQVQGFIGDHGGRRHIKMAYFIPVIYGERVVAVLATGSEVDEQEEVYHRIEAMEPLIDQVAIALEHARMYQSLERRTHQLEERDRRLAAFQEIGRTILSSLDLDEILDNMAEQVVRAGVFRSLMIAIVDQDRHRVEVVRSFSSKYENGQWLYGTIQKHGSVSSVVGLSYDLDDDNITAQVARLGQMRVIEEWDDNFDRRVDDPDDFADRVSYFIPVKKGEEVLAVLATGSEFKDREALLQRIESMQPFLDQLALAIEHARLYRALEGERERLAVTLASIGEGVVATDTAGRVILLNKVAETYSGWTQEEAIGENLSAVLGLHSVAAGDLLSSALDRDSSSELTREMELISKDGVARLIRHSSAPIRNEELRTVGAVLVLHDITQQQRMEGEVHRARRIESLGLLAGGIAHDFNNILASVLINVSVLKMQLGAQNIDLDIIHDIEISMGQARDLTQQIMAFTRDGNPELKAALIGELVRESATFVLRGSNVDCEFAIASDLLPVDIDKTQISQVVQNLIINAKQAMPDGGKISITLENITVNAATNLPLAPGHYVSCSIADKGSGIDEEDLHRIFDPYFTTKDEGNGLGLASALSIIHNHQGWITAESAPGQGTKFTFYLLAATDAVVAGTAETKLATLPLGRGRVLLMDDDDQLREAAGRALGLLGYDLLFAHNGEEAIEIYQYEREAGRSLVATILDLTVPGGMGAIESARMLLALDPQAKLIISTGYSQSPILANFRTYGFECMILKPYTMEELGRTIRRVL